MIRATRGQELRLTLFGNTEMNMIALSLLLTVGIAVSIMDVEGPMNAPLHVLSLSLNLCLSALAFIALILTHDVNGIFVAVHDNNLCAAAAANVGLLSAVRILWIPIAYNAAVSMMFLALRPLVGPERSWLFREQAELPLGLRSLPMWVLLGYIPVIFWMNAAVNAAALAVAHAGTFESQPVLPAGHFDWSSEGIKRELCNVALARSDIGQACDSGAPHESRNGGASPGAMSRLQLRPFKAPERRQPSTTSESTELEQGNTPSA